MTSLFRMNPVLRQKLSVFSRFARKARGGATRLETARQASFLADCAALCPHCRCDQPRYRAETREWTHTRQVGASFSIVLCSANALRNSLRNPLRPAGWRPLNYGEST